MTKEFRQFVEQFKSAWDKQSKLVLGYAEDKKEAEKVSRYLWRKVRQDMVNNRDNAIDQ